MTVFLLDTNVLIDYFSARLTRPFFDDVFQAGSHRLMTSVICVAEYCAGADLKQEGLLEKWILSGELLMAYVDQYNDAQKAGALRRLHQLKLPDALILSSAIRENACLLTHDQNLLQKAGQHVHVWDPFGGPR